MPLCFQVRAGNVLSDLLVAQHLSVLLNNIYVCRMDKMLKPKQMLEEEPTPNIFKLVLCIDQVMLRRRQDLVLGHCKNENGKEENALGLHGASEQLLLS